MQMFWKMKEYSILSTFGNNYLRCLKFVSDAVSNAIKMPNSIFVTDLVFPPCLTNLPT